MEILASEPNVLIKTFENKYVMNLGLTTKAMIGNRKILIALKTCREVDFIFKETSHFKIF